MPVDFRQSVEQLVEERLAELIRNDFGQRFLTLGLDIFTFYGLARPGMERLQSGGGSVTVAVGPRETRHRATGAIALPVRVTLSVGTDLSADAYLRDLASARLTNLFERFEMGEGLDELDLPRFRADSLAFVAGGTAEYSEVFSRWIVQFQLEVVGCVQHEG